MAGFERGKLVIGDKFNIGITILPARLETIKVFRINLASRKILVGNWERIEMAECMNTIMYKFKISLFYLLLLLVGCSPSGESILVINSDPEGADVYLDGELMGVTPYYGENLENGVHQLLLASDFSEAVEKTITLVPGIVVRREFRLQPSYATLSITSDPIDAWVEIDGRFATIEQRVLILEKLLIEVKLDEASELDVSVIEPGIYVLETNNIEFIDDNISGYVIYHLMITVKSNESEYAIQFGAGRKGLVNWQFYIDYDNDGLVDMDMIAEFLDSLPFMGVVSRTVDPAISQNIYRLFLSNIGVAIHTPPEQISEDASLISRQIWDYVQTQSIEMADWIKQR